ncbi:MAG: hypothetical protein GY856_36710 [bacterium]|nr:hypothetical protein [bacterium]
MAVTEEVLYGESEELAITGNVDLDPGKRVHVITSSDANRILTLPDATSQASMGGGVHWIFNHSGYTLAVKDNGGTTIKALADDYGLVMSLVDMSTAAGSWEFVLYPIDSGPAPPNPVEGFFVGGSGEGRNCRHWAPSTGTWTLYEDATPTSDHYFYNGAASFVVGPKGYITKEHPWNSENVWHAELDPISTWATRTPPTLLAVYGSGVGLTVASTAYGFTFGGEAVSSATGKEEVERYSPPPTDSWVTVTAQPVGRRKGSAAAIDDVAYVLGGRASDGAGLYSDANNAYIAATDSWNTGLQAIPIDGRGLFTAGATSMHVFVTGGARYTSYQFGLNIRSVTDRYDPDTDNWDSRTPHPGGDPPNTDGRRCEHAVVVIDDYLYQAGGWAWDGPDYPDHDDYLDPGCMRFDDSTDSWLIQTSMDQGVEGWWNQSMAIQT